MKKYVTIFLLIILLASPALAEEQEIDNDSLLDTTQLSDDSMVNKLIPDIDYPCQHIVITPNENYIVPFYVYEYSPKTSYKNMVSMYWFPMDLKETEEAISYNDYCEWPADKCFAERKFDIYRGPMGGVTLPACGTLVIDWWIPRLGYGLSSEEMFEFLYSTLEDNNEVAEIKKILDDELGYHAGEYHLDEMKYLIEDFIKLRVVSLNNDCIWFENGFGIKLKITVELDVDLPPGLYVPTGLGAGLLVFHEYLVDRDEVEFIENEFNLNCHYFDCSEEKGRKLYSDISRAIELKKYHDAVYGDNSVLYSFDLYRGKDYLEVRYNDLKILKSRRFDEDKSQEGVYWDTRSKDFKLVEFPVNPDAFASPYEAELFDFIHNDYNDWLHAHFFGVDLENDEDREINNLGW